MIHLICEEKVIVKLVSLVKLLNIYVSIGNRIHQCGDDDDDDDNNDDDGGGDRDDDDQDHGDDDGKE